SVGGGGGIAGSHMGSLGGDQANSEGGAITIQAGGSITAHGLNAPAIFAQSAGARNAGGPISIRVLQDAKVMGGTGDDGAGILLAGGDSGNNITVERDATLGGRGAAIAGTQGTAARIVNFGTING